MAYDKIIPIRSRLDYCIGYALNPSKTTGLETALNCDIGTAYRDIRETKDRWDNNNGVQGYHILHAYAPGEVTPEQAHRIGVEFAQQLLGEHYETVIATHADREHIHCHIVFNSVSFVDGKKYRDNFKAYFGDIRGTSNEVSRKHGLSVIEPADGGKHYSEWDAEQNGKPTIRSLIREDMDAAIAGAFTMKSFWQALEKQGYTIKKGENVKHTAVKPPGGSRFIRLSSLGKDYTDEAIKSRVFDRQTAAPSKPVVKAVPTRKRYIVQHRVSGRRRKKLRGLQAAYVRYLYLLSGKRQRRRVPFSDRKEVIKLHRYQRQFRLLREYGISTTGELDMLTDALQAEIDALTDKRRGFYQLKRRGVDMTPEIEEVNRQLRELRFKLKTCMQTVEDIPRIQSVRQTGKNEKQKEVHEYGHQR